MIEVDPKLFVTCRLCLEEIGVYQIVPEVQKKIKYCFDLNVCLTHDLYLKKSVKRHNCI